MDLEETLRRARSGDEDAVAQLYRAFASPLLGFLLTQVRRREDAEDLLGDVFVSAIKDLGRFEGDISGFRAWLYRIATNRAVDLARKRLRRPEEPLEDAGERADDADLEDEAIGRAERDRLWAAVRELPEQQREVIVLRLTGGLSASEIAEVIGKRTGAVKALQHRALANLAKALGARAYPEELTERLEL